VDQLGSFRFNSKRCQLATGRALVKRRKRKKKTMMRSMQRRSRVVERIRLR
jgi:hypothetical protein